MVKSFVSTILAAMLVASPAVAQTAPAPLKTFAYGSTSCAGQMLYFGSSWQINFANRPGAGQFPLGNFWLRLVTVTVMGGTPNVDWVVIGHSGPNGDWVSSAVLSGHSMVFSYPADAAPLFTAGEYFDAHTSSCNGGLNALISFGWVPAS